MKETNYQRSCKLFKRIIALPVKKEVHVFCFIYGVMQVRGFTEKELKATGAEILRKELEGNNPSPF